MLIYSPGVNKEFAPGADICYSIYTYVKPQVHLPREQNTESIDYMK